MMQIVGAIIVVWLIFLAISVIITFFTGGHSGDE